MSKNLQSLLLLLRQSELSRTVLLDTLKDGSISGKLKIDEFISLLEDSEENIVNNEIKELLIKLIEVTNPTEQDKFISKVYENSYFHYQEVISSVKPSGENIIDKYEDKRDMSLSKFYAIYPKVGACQFEIDGIIVSVTPKEPIIIHGGETISYIYTIKYSLNTGTADGLMKKFDQLFRERIYSSIGLNGNEATVTPNDEYTVNTTEFFNSLVEKYNSYYSTLVNNHGVTMDNVRGIETAFVDSNGVYIVPELFYRTYYIRDIFRNPQWIDIKSTYLKITLIVENDIIINEFIDHMRRLGVIISVKNTRTLFNESKKINMYETSFEINAVPLTQEEHDFQADDFYIDYKISLALRGLFREGVIFKKDSKEWGKDNNPDPVGTETYVFMIKDNKMVSFAHKRVTRETSYATPNTITLYRMFYTASKKSKDINLTAEVERYNNNINSMFQKRMRLVEQGANDSIMNYIPGSIVSSYDRDRKKISFLPFGFTCCYDQISDSTYESKFYSTDFGFTRVPMYNYIKVSKEQLNFEIPNITQVIVVSKKEPVFTKVKPLKFTKIDTNHYLCLFKSSDVDEIDKLVSSPDVKYEYACNYIKESNSNDVPNNNVISVYVDVEKINHNSFNMANILKYFIERMTISSKLDEIVFNSDVFSIYDLCQKFIDEGTGVDFFKTVQEISKTSPLNCKIIDDVLEIHEYSDINVINSLKCLVESIKIYISDDIIPEFGSKLNENLTGLATQEIQKAALLISREENSPNNSIVQTLQEMMRVSGNISPLGLDLAVKELISSLSYRISETEKLYGQKVNIDMIKILAGIYNDILFNLFIKSLYNKLSSYDLKKEIKKVIKNCDIEKISNHRYSVTVRDDEESRSNLNEIEGLNFDLITFCIITNDEDVYELGEYHYDPDVYCMFSIRYVGDIQEAIKQKLSSIHYRNRSTSIQAKISDISLYGKPYEVEDMKVQKFFLPFSNNRMKLFVKSIDDGVLSLENKTVSLLIDVDTNITNYKRFFKTFPCESLILGQAKYHVDGSDGYIYVFTKDLHNNTSAFPTAQRICKIFSKIKCGSNPYYKVNTPDIERNEKNKKINDKITKLREKYDDNFYDNFSFEYEYFKNNDFETLIINNGQNILTKMFGKKKDSDKLAIDNLKYQRKHTVYEDVVAAIEQITTIDSIIIRESVDKQNEIIRSNNMDFNIARSISFIGWDTKTINNYKFLSSSKIKGVRFSSNGYYMAVMFNNGVKIFVKIGDKYSYVSNLEHEGVNEVIFGNNMLCITIQKQDAEIPYAILWIASIGTKIKDVDLSYYKCVAGDLADIKYSVAGGVIKEQKCGLLEDLDGVMKFGNNNVESCKPIFNHNLYFFSPDDKYFIYNYQGSIKVFNTDTMTNVLFTVKNGQEVNNSLKTIKCIKNGLWSDNNTFNGITYLYNKRISYMKITLEMEKNFPTGIKNCINISPVLTDLPLVTEPVNIFVDEKQIVHPLYSYLMSIKERELTRINYGVWVNNLYISIYETDGKLGLSFTTESNNQYTCLIDCEILISMKDTLNKLIGLFNYTLDDNNITGISYNGRKIYGLSGSIPTTDNTIPMIYGYKYLFFMSSIYVWFTNSRGVIELTHIDENGYEKFIIEDYVSFYMGDNLNVTIIHDGKLHVRDINTAGEVNLDRSGRDVSKITVSFNREIETQYSVNISQSFERYDKKPLSSIGNLNEKLISSQMCLNRFDTMETFEHINSNNSTSHDNLMISVSDNKVTILPKSVFKHPNSKFGFTKKWYDEMRDSEEFILSKIGSLKEYLENVLVHFKSLKTYKSNIDFEEFKKYSARDRDLLKKMLTTIEGDRVYYLEGEKFRSYFNVTVDQCKSIDFLINFKYGKNTNPFNISNILSVYYEENLKRYRLYLLSLLKRGSRDIISVNNEYSTVIGHLSKIFGNIFDDFIIICVFEKIEGQFTEITGDIRRSKYGSIKEVKKLLDSEKKTNPQDTDILRFEYMKSVITLLVLEIPTDVQKNEGIDILDLYNIDTFRDKVLNVKNEIKRLYKMLDPVSEYERYRIKKRSEIVDQSKNLLRRSLAYLHKSLQDNKRSDFINLLMFSEEVITDIPEYLNFNEDGVYENDRYIFINNEENISKYDLEVYKTTAIIQKYDEFLALVFNESLLKSGLKINDLVLAFSDDFIKKLPNKKVRESMNPVHENYKNLKGEYENQMSKFTNVLSIINKTENIVDNMSELYNFLLEVSQMTKNAPLTPEQKLKVINTYDERLDYDSEYYLYEFNRRYINEENDYVQKCLKNAYYDASNIYNSSSHIRGITYPLLQKYRNGIECDTLNSVVKMVLTFDQNVLHVERTCSESENIIFKYKIPDEDLYIPKSRLHDNKQVDNEYGQISINMSEIFALYNTDDIRLPATIKYGVGYSYSGIDFGFKSIELGYKSKHSDKSSSYVDLKTRNIFSINPYKSLDGGYELVRDSKNEPVVFDYNSSKYLLYYTSATVKSYRNTIFVTQNIMTGETETYYYYLSKRGKLYSSDVGKIKYGDVTDENGNVMYNMLTINEKIPKMEYIADVGNREIKVDFVFKTTFYNLIKDLLPNQKESIMTTNNFEYIRKIEKIQYPTPSIFNKECDIISTFIITNNKRVVYLSEYKCGVNFGTIIEVFDRGILISSMNLNNIFIKSGSLIGNELLLVGLNAGYNDTLSDGKYVTFSMLKIGKIFIDRHLSHLPKFINFFDKEVIIVNNNILNLSSITCSNTHVSYRSNDVSYLVLINGDVITELTYITDIKSITISSNSEYIAVVLNDGRTDIWNCKGFLQETITGECFYLL